MDAFRIALANLRFAATAEDSIMLAEKAIAQESLPGSPTTSAVVRPDGTLLAWQPYGKEGLLIADIDISAATGPYAARCKSA